MARQGRRDNSGVQQWEQEQDPKRTETPAPDWSTRGGAAHHPRQDHQGELAQCPGHDHLRRDQEEATRPPGPMSQEEAHARAGASREANNTSSQPNWNTREAVGRSPGLEFPRLHTK